MQPCLSDRDVHRLAGLFAEVSPDLTGRLYHVLHNWEDARDAAQTTFLRCWQYRDRLDAVQDVRAWLYRIGLNVAFDLRRRVELRRATPLEALGDVTPERPTTAEDEAIRRDHLEVLRAALGALRPDEREVFRLRFEGGLTYEQIAAARGQPVGTVKTQMRAARRKLAERLTGERAA